MTNNQSGIEVPSFGLQNSMVCMLLQYFPCPISMRLEPQTSRAFYTWKFYRCTAEMSSPTWNGMLYTAMAHLHGQHSSPPVLGQLPCAIWSIAHCKLRNSPFSYTLDIPIDSWDSA